MLERAERHELQVPLQRLLLPLLEARRDYSAMAAAFRHAAQSCARAAECATRSGKRLLGTYYRVAFYGQVRFYYSITLFTVKRVSSSLFMVPAEYLLIKLVVLITHAQYFGAQMTHAQISFFKC